MEKAEDKANVIGDKLFEEALKAYGIDKQFVFASSVNAGVATIVTNGGTRVRYRAGDKVEPLDQIAVTGINPKPKRKPIAGK